MLSNYCSYCKMDPNKIFVWPLWREGFKGYTWKDARSPGPIPQCTVMDILISTYHSSGVFVITRLHIKLTMSFDNLSYWKQFQPNVWLPGGKCIKTRWHMLTLCCQKKTIGQNNFASFETLANNTFVWRLINNCELKSVFY